METISPLKLVNTFHCDRYKYEYYDDKFSMKTI